MISLLYSMMPFSIKETYRSIVKSGTSSPLYRIIIGTTTPASCHADFIVYRHWYPSTNCFDPSVAHAACTILSMSLFSTSFFFSLCTSSLQAIVLITDKNTIVRYERFCKPYLCKLFCAPSYIWCNIPSLVIHDFVLRIPPLFCIPSIVIPYMGVYTIVYMALYTITRYTWFCIPLYTRYMVLYMIVRYGYVYNRWIKKCFVFDVCVNHEPCKCACEGQ